MVANVLDAARYTEYSETCYVVAVEECGQLRERGRRGSARELAHDA